MNALNISKGIASGIVGVFSKNIIFHTPFIGEYLGRQIVPLVTASPFLPAGVALITTFAATWIIQKTQLCRETNHVKREILSLSVAVLTGAVTALISSSLVALLTGASLTIGSTLIAGAILGATMRIVALLVENLYILFSINGHFNEIETTFLNTGGVTTNGFHIENRGLANIFKKDKFYNDGTIEGNSLFFTLLPEGKIKAEYMVSTKSFRTTVYDDAETKRLWLCEDVLADTDLSKIFRETCVSGGGYWWPPMLKLQGFHRLLDQVDIEINNLKYLSVFHPVVNKFDKLKAQLKLMIEKTQHTLAGWDILVNQYKKRIGENIKTQFHQHLPEIKPLIEKWELGINK